VGKASLQVVASARNSSFSGYGAFTAAAKQQSSRGVRSAMRRSAVLTKAKVTIAQQSDHGLHARSKQCRHKFDIIVFVIAARRQPG
jgi:hypothetical protein